jgi:hypothetical protein
MPIQRENHFATPESTEALLEWINLYNGSEKAIVATAAMMGWNLACKIIEDDEAVANNFNNAWRECNFQFNAEFRKNRQEAFDRYEKEAREHG